jgi:hypothetical protein
MPQLQKTTPVAATVFRKSLRFISLDIITSFPFAANISIGIEKIQILPAQKSFPKTKLIPPFEALMRAYSRFPFSQPPPEGYIPRVLL